MKRIICFGDSNTYGHTPGTGLRQPEEVRWPCVLRRNLGPDFQVIEEGLNGRTIDQEDPETIGRNGMTYLVPCLRSHVPADLLILMLGTNDVKAIFPTTPESIAASMGRMIDTAKEELAPYGGRILLVGPLPILPEMRYSEYAEMYGYEAAAGRAAALRPLYRVLAEEKGVFYWEPSDAVEVSLIDALHMSAQGQARFGEEITPVVRKILDDVK